MIRRYSYAFGFSLLASRAIAESLQDRALGVIESALGGSDGELASVALSYAPGLEQDWVEPGIEKVASHPNPTLRIAALDAMAELNPDSAAAQYEKALLDPQESYVVRLVAEEKLPALSDQSARPLFRQLLHDPDPTLRVLAAGALLELGDRAGLPVLEEALAGDDLGLKVDAASELLHAEVEQAKALRALTDVIESPETEPVPRSNAAYALGETKNPDAIPILVEALKDADRAVRLAAANSMGLFSDKMAPLLMEMATTDPDPLVRLEAVHGLKETGNPKADLALRKTLEDPDAFVRMAAVSTLGQRGAAGDAELVEIARAGIEGKDYNIRLAAITAMGQVGDSTVASYLEPRLGDDDPMTRLIAAIAIDRILSR